ncbi:unnamed protein product [Medioppia subpectinata]|uniref:Sodium/calcium exchanger membrane region domain-containing protein n=1 Tax=Medioppia subpectinata TaxID=1979941 RepID=A0A7R9KQE9_9ACAR|nr:unnamed protein product [Medioppia subpectinata]CAG2107627.1 unnamed protein product [Medioppia subpectinata]
MLSILTTKCYSYLFYSIDVIISPQAFLFITEMSNDQNYIMEGIVFGVSILVALVVFFTSETEKPPVYHWVFAYFGFVIAVSWIYALANEVVDLLTAIGIIFNLSHLLLGLTVLAWGNSVGDMLLGIGIPYTVLLSSGTTVTCTYWETQGVKTVNVSLYTRFTKQWYEWEQDLYKRYGKVFGVYEITKPVLFVSDPELIRDILVKDFHIFTNRRDFRTGADPLMDNMLGAVQDDQWKKIRSIMSPTFSTGKLKKMMPLIVECRNSLIDNLDKIAKTNGEKDMKRLFGAYAMEVVIQVAFGTKVDAMFDENNVIIENAKKMFGKNMTPKQLFAVLVPKLAKRFKISMFDSNITNFFKDFTLNIIEERKRNKNEVKRVDFLQLMLDSEENNNTIASEDNNNHSEKYKELQTSDDIDKTLTNDELIGQCVLFFLAGYETSATTMSLCLNQIANYPEVQQKLYLESKKYFDEFKGVDYDELNSLKYLNAVIMETQRLFPAAFFLERAPNEDYELRGTGITIKKGHIVHIPTYAMHRDPENFADPEVFRPERFLAENIAHHPYAYLPFGAGPRNCIGMRLAQMEIRLGLISVVNRYRFYPSEVCLKPLEFFCNVGAMIPKAIPVKVERRLYVSSQCTYWETQGVKTDSVSLYTRFTKQWYEWEQDLYKRNGKIFGIYEITKPVLFVSDPELVRDILVKDFHIFNNRRVNKKY